MLGACNFVFRKKRNCTIYVVEIKGLISSIREARWPSGRASDSRARDRGFDPHSGRHVVFLGKLHLLPKSTDNTKEAVAPSQHD